MRAIRHIRVVAMLLAGMCTSGGTGQENVHSNPPTLPPGFFDQQVHPILKQHCYECHSAEADKIKGGLLLDSRERLLQGGDSGPGIIPGDIEGSRLIQAIRYSDPDLQMPPKTPLRADQVAILERWVLHGAPYPERSVVQPLRVQSNTNHWAFLPLNVPARRQANHPTASRRFADDSLPTVRNADWPKDPLDHFILAELEKRGLSPSPPADKRTLIRRATFDLIGLPPAVEEVEAFLKDDSPRAFEAVIDRLLDSPHFGERWGRHWLDVARYSDSNGLEVNLPYPNAWRYRDYVIAAFNRDKPFDQFIREQIAGDLLPFDSEQQRFEQLTATAFLALGPKALGESSPEQLKLDVVDEQIDVTTRAFLGLTVSCARCHDHKFDPIPARDYYALAGIFESTTSLTRGAGANMSGTRWLERPLASAEEAKAIEEHRRKMDQLSELIRIVRENPGGINSSKLPGIVVDNLAAQLSGRWKESLGLTNFVDKNYHHDANSDKGKMTARFVPKLPHTGEYEVLIAYTPSGNRATNVPVRIETAQGVQTVFVDQRQPPQFRNAFVTLGTYSFQAGTNGAVVISNENTQGFVIVDAVQFVPIDEWKLELAAMESERAEQAQRMRKPGSDGANPMAPSMRAPVAIASPEYRELQYRLLELRSQTPPPAPATMAVQDGTVVDSKIRIRGDVDRLGPEVSRGFIKVVARNSELSELPASESGRLELAEWIASPDNPLTARVAVNRIWLHLIGRGLVDTPDNFGVLGESPSHPELLDHLAWRFITEGWSVKKLIRLLMLSSTYQMSASHNPAAYRQDPENRLLWRMNRHRLEAEALRDAILAVSGQLDRTAGGPALPADVTAGNEPIPETRVDAELTNRRRSVYLPIRRNNVPEMLQVFDFADPHAMLGKRHVTTAATQALFMMNSAFVLQQARHFADQLLALDQSDAERIETAYLRAFGRPPTANEIDRALAFLRTFEASDENGAPLAWQSFCQVLFASTEFRFSN